MALESSINLKALYCLMVFYVCTSGRWQPLAISEENRWIPVVQQVSAPPVFSFSPLSLLLISRDSVKWHILLIRLMCMYLPANNEDWPSSLQWGLTFHLEKCKLIIGLTRKLGPHGSKISVFCRGCQALLDVAKGLYCLHQNKICHRDIKSPNILINEHGRCKISDLGLGRLLTGEDTAATAVGSWNWMAAEMMSGRYKI